MIKIRLSDSDAAPANHQVAIHLSIYCNQEREKVPFKKKTRLTHINLYILVFIHSSYYYPLECISLSKD